MDGVRVARGDRRAGARHRRMGEYPKVEGGPAKRLFFTWFQPVMLFALLAFWFYAPNSIAKASTAVAIGVGFKVLLLGLEWLAPRHDSWRLTWKELTSDLFYVGLGYTLLRRRRQLHRRWCDHQGGAAFVRLGQTVLVYQPAVAVAGLPDLVRLRLRPILDASRNAQLASAVDRARAAPLHHPAQHQQGAVGNPVELFLIGLGVGGFFDFVPRAVLLAGAFGLAVGTYQHINVRLQFAALVALPVQHHRASQRPPFADFEASRSNYTNTW